MQQNNNVPYDEYNQNRPNQGRSQNLYQMIFQMQNNQHNDMNIPEIVQSIQNVQEHSSEEMAEESTEESDEMNFFRVENNSLMPENPNLNFDYTNDSFHYLGEIEYVQENFKASPLEGGLLLKDLPILALKDVVLMPGETIPFKIFERNQRLMFLDIISQIPFKHFGKKKNFKIPFTNLSI